MRVFRAEQPCENTYMHNKMVKKLEDQCPVFQPVFAVLPKT